ncbi:amino acid ABC transporter substrate-binding protein [Brucella neotomae]|nr:amino acid ABC transporter substrate-binding protein [Brucella neotomae]SPU69259.1 amino acid ABC transporter substrate-binding protein [Brucella neotomae]SUW39089.1 amino acid ABC transporter substrate-binding protein [Brucella neotomae]
MRGGNREKFTFTRSYMRLPARFATSNAKSFTEPAAKATQDKPVGVIAGTAHEALLKNYFPQAKPVPYPNRDAMLTALKDGKIDTVFDDGMSLSAWLDSAEGSACCTFTDGPYLAPQYLGSGLSIAVTRQNSALASAFNNALQQEGKLTELYLRYFPASFY